MTTPRVYRWPHPWEIALSRSRSYPCFLTSSRLPNSVATSYLYICTFTSITDTNRSPICFRLHRHRSCRESKGHPLIPPKKLRARESVTYPKVVNEQPPHVNTPPPTTVEGHITKSVDKERELLDVTLLAWVIVVVFTGEAVGVPPVVILRNFIAAVTQHVVDDIVVYRACQYTS